MNTSYGGGLASAAW